MGKGSNKTTTTSNQTQAYTPSPYISAAGQQALTGAQGAANAPFQMPVAPTAEFSPLQQQAFNQIQGMQGMSLPYFQQGASMLQGSAAPITGQDVGQYYNPFAQNVTNQMQNIFGQQNRMATSNAVRAAGGVGADRIGVAQANLANQQGLAAGQTYAGMYNQALQAAQQQRQMMAGAGFGMGQLGGAAQTSYLQGTGALAQAGAQQQALNQAQQNAVYQNRLAEIAYPFQTNQYLAGITGGLAPSMGGTTTGQGTSVTERPQPSPLNQILGLAGTAAGAFFGGPAGAAIGGQLGSSLGGGGGKGTASGGQPESSAPWGTTSMGGFGFNYGNRGGRVNGYASGGAAYGRLAEQRFADSPVGNPYASSASDDSESESEDHGYADGGPLPQGPMASSPQGMPSPQMAPPPPPQGMMPPGMPQGMPGPQGTPRPMSQQISPQQMLQVMQMRRGMPPGMPQRMPGQMMPQGVPPPQQMAPQVTPQMMQQMQLLQQRRPMPMPQGPPPVPQQIPQQPMGIPQRSPFGMAEGGAVEEEPLAMPGSKAPPVTAMTTVPSVPLRIGAGHSGLLSPLTPPISLDLRHAPEEKPQSSSGLSQAASGIGKYLSKKGAGSSGGDDSEIVTGGPNDSFELDAARGGAVNPFDAGQGFEAGGYTGAEWADDSEPLQGIDAPMGRTEEPRYTQPSSHGPVFPVTPSDYKSPFQKYTEANPTSEADVPLVRPSSPFEGTAPEPLPPPEASRLGREGIAGAAQEGPAAAPEGPANPFAPGEQVPMPLGDPRKPGGAKYVMVGELEKGRASRNAIAGISMNVKDESNFNPFSRTIGDQHDPRFRGTEAEHGHGLFQEGGDEWNNYQAWLRKNYPESQWQDPRLQTRFLVERLKTGYPETWAKMQNARTPGEAAAIFTSEYLRPAKQYEVARVRKYLGGGGDEEAGGETNVSARESRPNIVGNRDLTIDRLRMPREKMPYPGASEQNWGTRLARNPWSALIVGGARMAQTTGPVGSALGAGIEAGVGHLEGQRKSLATEEGINQRAEGLYQSAQKHLDQYQRMTPYQEYMKDYHKETLERTKYQPANMEIMGPDGEPITKAVRFNPKTGVYEDPETGEPIHGKLIARQSGAESATSRANEAFRSAKDDPNYYSDQTGTINKHRAAVGLPPRKDLGTTKETAIPDPGEKARKPGMWYIVDGVARQWR